MIIIRRFLNFTSHYNLDEIKKAYICLLNEPVYIPDLKTEEIWGGEFNFDHYSREFNNFEKNYIEKYMIPKMRKVDILRYLLSVEYSYGFNVLDDWEYFKSCFNEED